jgi:hypothetical protein
MTNSGDGPLNVHRARSARGHPRGNQRTLALPLLVVALAMLAVGMVLPQGLVLATGVVLAGVAVELLSTRRDPTQRHPRP